MHLRRRGSHIALGPLPLDADEPSMELLRQIQCLTCSGRSVMSVTDEQLFICFEAIEDAAEFFDSWDFLPQHDCRCSRRARQATARHRCRPHPFEVSQVTLTMNHKETDNGQMDISRLQREAFGEIEVVERSCPLCGEGNSDVPPNRYSLGFWTAKSCPNCCMVYLDKAPKYEALVNQLSWQRTRQVERDWRASTRPILHRISTTTRWRLRLLPRRAVAGMLSRRVLGGNVVDIGCGTGKRLENLPEGFVPHGIEIGEEAAAIANDNYSRRGGGVVNAPALDGLRRFPDGYFSGAVLRSYLEHEFQPAEVLTELRRTMAHDGVAIVKVPNFGSWNRKLLGRRWSGFRHPDHLNYFTPQTLRAMGEKCGFRVRSGFFHRLPTADNMYAFFSKFCILVAALLP